MKNETTKSTTSNKTTKREKTPKTLLDAFKSVLKKSHDSELKKSYYTQAKAELTYIGEKLNVTPVEATMLAVVINESMTSQCIKSDFCRHFDISGLSAIELNEPINSLIRKGLLHKGCNRNSDECFSVPKALIDCISENKAYTVPSRKCSNEREFFTHLDELFCMRDDDVLDGDQFDEETTALLKANNDLNFPKTYIEYATNVSKNEATVLLLFCMLFYRGSRRGVTQRDWRFLFDNQFKSSCIDQDMSAGTSKLVRENIIKVCDFDGLMNINEYELTDKAKHRLFPTLTRKKSSVRKDSCIISHKEINAKDLFYNKSVQNQVDTLCDLLKPERLKSVQERMRKVGMKTGVCCLFYGAAGAGKTELARQLARKTGRDLFQIDLSQVRSKWVGDSEKNIQEVFDRYKAALKSSRRQPILLFNEADALMNKRQEGAMRAVEKSENTIANIILQNMEDFEDGILIATTNLAKSNMDSAFERRFLYKLEFEKPDEGVRLKIWESILNDVPEDVLVRLSKEYIFTGGQIQNIGKKKLVDEILTGEKAGYEELRQYCNQESISGSNNHSSVGFRHNQ